MGLPGGGWAGWAGRAELGWAGRPGLRWAAVRCTAIEGTTHAHASFVSSTSAFSSCLFDAESTALLSQAARGCPTDVGVLGRVAPAHCSGATPFSSCPVSLVSPSTYCPPRLTFAPVSISLPLMVHMLTLPHCVRIPTETRTPLHRPPFYSSPLHAPFSLHLFTAQQAAAQQQQQQRSSKQQRCCTAAVCAKHTELS